MVPGAAAVAGCPLVRNVFAAQITHTDTNEGRCLGGTCAFLTWVVGTGGFHLASLLRKVRFIKKAMFGESLNPIGVEQWVAGAQDSELLWV